MDFPLGCLLNPEIRLHPFWLCHFFPIADYCPSRTIFIYCMAEMKHSRVKPTAKTKLTIRLTPECIAFVKEYAQAHGMTVTEVIQRFLDRLQSRQQSPIHPEVARFSPDFSRVAAVGHP